MVNLYNLLDATADASATPSTAANLISTFLPLILIIGVFYFLMIRPQKKKDQAVKDMLAALKVGDPIATIGGIYGTISELKNDTVTIVVGVQKTPMVIARWAIKSVGSAPVENDAAPQA